MQDPDACFVIKDPDPEYFIRHFLIYFIFLPELLAVEVSKRQPHLAVKGCALHTPVRGNALLVATQFRQQAAQVRVYAIQLVGGRGGLRQ